jgi:hypothetical protein
MTIEARKISLVQEFLRIDNEDIIKALEDLLHQSKIEAFKKNFKPNVFRGIYSEID